MSSFNELGLAAPILQALASGPYNTPTPIQAQAIPHVMQGRDLLGIAQTGTGKTAAFALPILHRLAQPDANGKRPRAQQRGCRALVLSPTRELASQIAERFRFYGHKLGVSVAIVFGGVSPGPQIKQMLQGVDILVATPGRLLDHTNSRNIRLDQTEIVVLDEADQMFDMGFIQPLRRIVAQLPARRQSLFFSATFPDDIAKLAGGMLRDPVRVAVTPVAATADRVEQRVIHVDANAKRTLLGELLKDESIHRTLIFTRTKRGADKVSRHLEQLGVPSSAIHGNKSQSQRERALSAFREGKLRALVATDIAARGIDIPDVSHVINFELPNLPESYVHRIGRTARAGRAGIAIAFCDHEERAYLRDIERLIRQKIPAEDRRGTIKVAAETAGSAQPHGRGEQGRGEHTRGEQGRGEHRQGRGRGHGERQSHGERQGHGQDQRRSNDQGYRGKPAGNAQQGENRRAEGHRAEGGYKGKSQNHAGGAAGQHQGGKPNGQHRPHRSGGQGHGGGRSEGQHNGGQRNAGQRSGGQRNGGRQAARG
ncbi:DEAD/DEAH box helicase [Ferrovibrio sp.]|uniref:DEAD/DEAH box helicase n=1 Tax=Ferrovibrio sp. TaxID=1917215 RepID=UPI0035B3D408